MHYHLCIGLSSLYVWFEAELFDRNLEACRCALEAQAEVRSVGGTLVHNVCVYDGLGVGGFVK